MGANKLTNTKMAVIILRSIAVDLGSTLFSGTNEIQNFKLMCQTGLKSL
jgi:hypothetical protein